MLTSSSEIFANDDIHEFTYESFLLVLPNHSHVLSTSTAQIGELPFNYSTMNLNTAYATKAAHVLLIKLPLARVSLTPPFEKGN